MASTVANVASFIRRNILAILAVPPVVAMGFGVYAKKLRPRRQKSGSAATDENYSVDTEELKNS